MTEQQLQEIEQRIPTVTVANNEPQWDRVDAMVPLGDVTALIAEVRRLREQQETLREWQVNVTSALMQPDSGGLHYADVPKYAKQLRQQRDAVVADRNAARAEAQAAADIAGVWRRAYDDECAKNQGAAR